jgi:hypothetical protein
VHYRKRHINENMLAGSLTRIGSISVAITLIIVIGIVYIVVIFKYYRVVIRDNEIILERN